VAETSHCVLMLFLAQFHLDAVSYTVSLIAELEGLFIYRIACTSKDSRISRLSLIPYVDSVAVPLLSSVIASIGVEISLCVIGGEESE
jgi:hypothetical protein